MYTTVLTSAGSFHDVLFLRELISNNPLSQETKPMSNPRHVDKLRISAFEFNQWREDNPGTAPDFSGADITDVDLLGANLTDADLTGVVMNDDDIRGLIPFKADALLWVRLAAMCTKKSIEAMGTQT